MIKRATGVALAGIVFGAVLVAVAPHAASAPKKTSNARNAFDADAAFLDLREAARANNATRSEEIATRLGDYAIPSYVDYYRLKPRIAVASEQEIRGYLQRYSGQAIADRLRNDWLLELGRARNWALFDEQYPKFVLDDDPQVKCYALMSRALKGEQVADPARAALIAPQNYGEACPALIATLVEARQFNLDDVWAQVRLTAESGFAATLRRIAPLTQAGEQALLQAVEKPDAVLDRDPGKDRASRELFIIALGRSAKRDPDRAVSRLVAASSRLTQEDLPQAWAQIAHQASLKLLPEAPVYWHRTDGARLSNDAHQWKARAGLRAADWKLVRNAIDAMPPSLASDPAWVYWKGRALLVEGRQVEARQQFQSIANHHGFYGQLALEELNQKIAIPQRAQPVTQEELAPMANNQGFQRALKFFDLDMRLEGNREWNWELRPMNERQMLAAAEFARQRNVLDRMVNTSDRTKSEFDFTQRFPTPHRNVMLDATERLGLDMAWVYGLIRQESRFIQHARSHAGASGLMQVMPETARYVARKIGLSDYHHGRMNDIETNILLGTSYLNMVLNDLDRSQTLATAAYNAGPGRPRAWRSSLQRVVEGAVFAESIPFSETRDYVKKVLSNATYYAALFENKPQSLKARLGSVAPKGFEESQLP